MPTEVSTAVNDETSVITKDTPEGDKKNWLKWAVAYSTVRMQGCGRHRRFNLYDIDAKGDPVKLGYFIPQLEKDLESPHPESHLQEGADEVCVYGVNSKAECVLVRISRGLNQLSEAWLYLKLANGKTYRLEENSGYQQSFDDKCMNFSCGNLQMQYLAPMRKWRIFYCGMLKEISEDKTEKLVFVKFVLLWKASSDVYDISMETNPKGFIEAVSRVEWESNFSPPFDKLSEVLNGYCQSGIINGTVSVENGDDYPLYLFGGKMRNLGKTANYDAVKFVNIVANLPVHGVSFHVGKGSIHGVFKDLVYGVVVSPEGNMIVVDELDLNIDKPSGRSSHREVKAVFNAGRKYNLQGKVVGDPIVFNNNQGFAGNVEVSFIEFTESDRKGYGLLMSGENLKGSKNETKPTAITPFPKFVPLTVKFSDEVSHFGDISGGKGSSLGKLTALSKEVESFTVPKGIVVTTAAYSEFLNTEIKEAIQKLENVMYGNVKGDSKEVCVMVANVVERSTLPTKICNSISRDLKELFGDDLGKHKFAVRSSATGEDTSAMSAAGQMDTFLGIQGLEEIYKAVKKCWASQFGYIATEYKRRNGQIINSPMAVVIQEMVASEVSGVLFTVDPVTNNPSVITITANYGLGETVVSGSVEPDTITLKRLPGGKLQYDTVVIGSKLQRMVMNESGGTVTEDIPEGSRNDSCLTREMAEELGYLAVKIEKYYKSSRDIEWGINKNNVYILQSRPVTNIAADAEYEIKHEFDTAMRCEIEYFTKANLGEVMPGATSPLGLDVVVKYVSIMLRRQAIKMGYVDNMLQSKYYTTGLVPFYSHMMATIELITRFGFDTVMAKGFMLSTFGRVLDDPDLLSYVKDKYAACTAAAPKPSLTIMYRHYKLLYFHDSANDAVKKRIFGHPLNFLKQGTAKETFKTMFDVCSEFDEGGMCHNDNSETSSNWNLSLFLILSEAHGDNEQAVFSDFAKLLGYSSGVESANVPQALQEVASQVVKDMDCDKFKAMPVEEAVEWITTTTSQTGEKFRQFIKRHGHRCLKELDVYTVTWESDPKSLVKILQSLAGTGGEFIEQGGDLDIGKLITELNLPLGFKAKMRLKHTLPHCLRAIRGREHGKTCLVKVFDHFRKGFRRLAQLMVSEGRIPEEDIVFFMTIEEIRELLETRNPAIISRAYSRKKMHPVLDQYLFPEIMRGTPKPMNDETETAETYEFVADLTMTGTPVSHGVAKGYARVAMNVEEASHLKKGEILVTYSTDIGWSPYFPIVAGVVTELGGLVSHGAVVSREYGLPCVVGMRGATKRFQTGDYVLIDGKKGTLQRLPKPEE